MVSCISCLGSLGCLPHSKRARPFINNLHPIESSPRPLRPNPISHPLPLRPRLPANAFPVPTPTRRGVDYGILLDGLPPSLADHYRAMPPGRAEQAEDVLRASEHSAEDLGVFHGCGSDGCLGISARPISRFVDSVVESDAVISRVLSLDDNCESLCVPSRRCKHRETANGRSTTTSSSSSIEPSLAIPPPPPTVITASNSQNSRSLRDAKSQDLFIPIIRTCSTTATLGICDLDAHPARDEGHHEETRLDEERVHDKHTSSRDDDAPYAPDIPPSLNIHKELPPLPVPSASSSPPSTPLAVPHFLSVPARCGVPSSGHANTNMCPSHKLSPLITASPLATISAGQSLAEDPHLKWTNDGDGTRPLARVSRYDGVCPTPGGTTNTAHVDLPIQSSSFSTPSLLRSQSLQGSNSSAPLLTTPIPRVSSFLDFWVDTDERLKRHAVAENSDLVERWFEASGRPTNHEFALGQNVFDLAVGWDGERLFDDGGHEGDWDGDQDEHNRALVLGIAYNIVSAFLRRWSARTREVEDSALLNPPSFDLARFPRDDFAGQPDEDEQRGMERVEGVGRDLMQGEASLREALDVAKNLDLDGDARVLLRGVLMILEELLKPDAPGPAPRNDWLCTELGLLFEHESNLPRISQTGAREERDRRKWLQDATIRALLGCGEDQEVKDRGVWEAYALIMREMKGVEERG